MEIKLCTTRTPELIEELAQIWENAVRSTHKFLSESAIEKFKTTVPTIIQDVPVLLIATDQNHPAAFLGLTDQEVDMLFVDSNLRGHEIGKKLLQYAITNYSANTLTVNEQNPQAVGFYEHLGFEVYKRTETDGLGNPYPILYMTKG